MTRYGTRCRSIDQVSFRIRSNRLGRFPCVPSENPLCVEALEFGPLLVEWGWGHLSNRFLPSKKAGRIKIFAKAKFDLHADRLRRMHCRHPKIWWKMRCGRDLHRMSHGDQKRRTMMGHKIRWPGTKAW